MSIASIISDKISVLVAAGNVPEAEEMQKYSSEVVIKIVEESAKKGASEDKMTSLVENSLKSEEEVSSAATADPKLAATMAMSLTQGTRSPESADSSRAGLVAVVNLMNATGQMGDFIATTAKQPSGLGMLKMMSHEIAGQGVAVNFQSSLDEFLLNNARQGEFDAINIGEIGAKMDEEIKSQASQTASNSYSR